MLIAQSENGLFNEERVTVKFETIEDTLDKARKDFLKAGDDLSETQKDVETCWSLINKALNEAGDSYRNQFLHVRRLSVIVSVATIAVVAALGVVGAGNWFGDVPYWTLLVGSLGGCVRSLWWLFNHIDKKDFRRTWWFWYLVSPLVGAGLGVFTYLAILATATAATVATSLTPQNGLTMFLVGFAGFNWTWAVQFLEGIAGSHSGGGGKRP